MKLLIVGGTGLLSSAVTCEALNKGLDVCLINRGNSSLKFSSQVEIFKSDINDTVAIQQFLQERHFDAVIDFICYNEKQLQHSLELFKKYVNQYIFISSSAVYNTIENGIMNEGSAKILKEWDYSIDKFNCEQSLIRLAAINHLPYTIIRPCITYGNTRIPYGITPNYGYHGTLIERIRRGKPIITWNKGINRWNMMRVEDFAVGVIGLVGCTEAYNQDFNICGDETPSWHEVLEVLGIIIGHKAIEFDISTAEYSKELANRKGEIFARSLNSICSNTKLKQLVPEFRPRISLEAGLKETVDYYTNNKTLKRIDYTYDGESDRIISKYRGYSGNQYGSDTMRFIDYLGNATVKDRLDYYKKRHADNIIVKLLAK